MKRRVSRQAAAELLSNTEKTFRECYEETHHQSASRELVSFWRDAEALVSAVGPGGCQEAKPKLRDDAPEGAPKPDCEGGGGCLFCDKNRDLRSFDHAWNLASFHHLKLAELNADRTPLSLKMRHPVALVIERVAALKARFLSRDDVPEDVVASERRIAEETAKAEGKPEQALPKIVEGRLNGFFKDAVLLEQPSVSDSKKTVKALLDEAGVTVTRFVRFEVGQA